MHARTHLQHSSVHKEYLKIGHNTMYSVVWYFCDPNGCSHGQNSRLLLFGQFVPILAQT